MKHVLALIMGLAVGALILFYGVGAFSPRHVQAQAQPVELSQEQKVFRFKKWLERTKPAAFGNPAGIPETSTGEAAKRSRILTRAMRAKIPPLSGQLITKGGLAGVAAGVVIYDGVILYNAVECGKTDCPEPLEINAEFRQALDAAGNTPGAQGSTWKMVNGAGVTLTEGMITRIDYEFSSATNQCKMTMQYLGKWNAGYTSGPSIGLNGGGAPEGSRCAFTIQPAPPTSASTTKSPYLKQASNEYLGPMSCRARGFATTQNFQTGVTTQAGFGPEFVCGVTKTWENPVYDVVGAEVVNQVPAAPEPYRVSPATSDELYDAVVADPETCPVENPGEVCPDYPPDWDDYPIAPVDPTEDPDDDGVPNVDDPDDDGDGVPDVDDPAPYNPTVPAPNTTPDRDDEDGDGIPDTDDPYPYDPTHPEDAPSSDPDEDGIPNVDDPDDDNDGIPDEDDPEPYTPTDPGEMPDDSPFGDPDEDGDPNRLDRDDDGDGGEDWKDEERFVPLAIPWGDPGQPDEDEDGVPTIEDPWPGNPFAPADPGLDEDEDGIPDFQDPKPTDTEVPWAPPNPYSAPSPGAPGDPGPNSPNQPGQDTIPENPPNTEYPTNPGWRGTEPVADPTNPTAPGEPISRGEPDDPTIPGSPDPPRDGGTCPSTRAPNLDLPEVPLEDVFPFSLLLYAWDALGDLVGAPAAPEFDFPEPIGTVTVPASADAAMGIIRGIIGFVTVSGMCFFFYRHISGKG